MSKLMSLVRTVQTMYYEIRRILTGRVWLASIDIINKCNLACKHCYVQFDKGDSHPLNDMPIEDWDTKFRKLHKDGIRKVVLIGGEPSLRPDIVMLAQEIFFSTATITNGLVKLPDEYYGSIIISIDGTEETNDAIRGKSVFKRVINNYSGDRRCILNTTLMKSNYLELEDIVKIAIEHSFLYVTNNIFISPLDDPNFINEDLRAKIVAEMDRVHKLYPRHYFVNERILDWYSVADHSDHCLWNKNAIHLDLNDTKTKCFTDTICTNCGCLAGGAASNLEFKYVIRHPIKTIKSAKAYLEMVKDEP